MENTPPEKVMEAGCGLIPPRLTEPMVMVDPLPCASLIRSPITPIMLTAVAGPGTVTTYPPADPSSNAAVSLAPGTTFDDQFVAALGARVNAYLAELGAPAPQVQPNPASSPSAPAPRSPAPPPASLTPGTRGSDEQSLEDEIAEIMEL